LPIQEIVAFPYLHRTAVRLNGGASDAENVTTIAGKEFTLINVPWYQVAKMEAYVERFGESGAPG
jgi:hypothetical protein